MTPGTTGSRRDVQSHIRRTVRRRVPRSNRRPLRHGEQQGIRCTSPRPLLRDFPTPSVAWLTSRSSCRSPLVAQESASQDGGWNNGPTTVPVHSPESRLMAPQHSRRIAFHYEQPSRAEPHICSHPSRPGTRHDVLWTKAFSLSPLGGRRRRNWLGQRCPGQFRVSRLQRPLHIPMDVSGGHRGRCSQALSFVVRLAWTSITACSPRGTIGPTRDAVN